MISITLFTDDFEICSPDGSRKAGMDSGRFFSGDREIFPYRPVGVKSAGNTVYLPPGIWRIKDTSAEAPGLEFDAVDTDLRIYFKSTAGCAELELDNKDDVCLVRLQESSGDCLQASVYFKKGHLNDDALTEGSSVIQAAEYSNTAAKTDISGECADAEAVIGFRRGYIVMEGLIQVPPGGADRKNH